MRAFGFIGVLGTLLIALVAGVIGYNLGLGANVASVATTTGTTVVYHGWGFGFPFFGFIFAILFVVLIFGLIRRAAWGGYRGGGHGAGGWGPGGWGHRTGWEGRSMPPMADEILERWHRQKHGEPDTTDGTRSASPTS